LFFVGDVMIGVIFAFFWSSLPGPGRQPNESFYGSSFCWKLGYDLSFQIPWLAF